MQMLKKIAAAERDFGGHSTVGVEHHTVRTTSRVFEVEVIRASCMAANRGGLCKCVRASLPKAVIVNSKRVALQANSEVSALLGRIPSAVGYQPTLATDLGSLQERITTTDKGSITSVQVPPSVPAVALAEGRLGAGTEESKELRFSTRGVSDALPLLPMWCRAAGVEWKHRTGSAIQQADDARKDLGAPADWFPRPAVLEKVPCETNPKHERPGLARAHTSLSLFRAGHLRAGR